MDHRLKNNPDFRRLKQGGLGFNGRTSYWLGRDHLLVIEVSNYTERYRRLFFRDLQAVTMQTTQALVWGNLGLAILTVFSILGLALALLNPGTEPAGWALLAFATGCGILALLGGVGLVLNWRRGPTCVVYFRTAVQTHRLRGLTRWRKAEELMAEIVPLIGSAQRTPEKAGHASSAGN
jgi:hypothetical protein